MEEIKDLIVVKQLPVIEEKLKSISDRVDDDIKKAIAMECNEKNKQEVKDKKAELKKTFQDLEDRRKAVKEAVMKPYNEFNAIYEEYISQKFQNADEELKNKIAKIEDEQKDEIREKIIELFESRIEESSEDISFIKFEDMNFKVKLGDATENGSLTKKTKEAVEKFISDIENDIKVINKQQYKDEVLYEYKKNRNLTESIEMVTDRHFILEENAKAEKEAKQNQEQELNDEIMLEKIENISAPKEIVKEETSEEVFEMTFKVRGTKEQLKAVKEFLINGGYDYE